MDNGRDSKRRDDGSAVAARTARKLVLPAFVLTEVAQPGDAEAALVRLPSEGQPEGVTYYTRPLSMAESGARRDGRPNWVKYQFNLLPVVLDKNGAPWAEAIVYLLWRLENELNPSMATITAIADGLVAYRQFLDDNGLDWAEFPQQRLSRPTYRYHGHLRYAIGAGEVGASTAKRRMSAVVSFYRWLRQEGVLSIKNEPWKESERFITLKDQHGLDIHKKVRTTDIAVRVPQQRDPYDGRIDDGGRLRPLPASEQMWLADALAAADNPEMTLIHLVSLLTGARIQTVLTLQARHVLTDTALVSVPELRLPVGPGTGVDTKNDKRLVLVFPMWFYRQLQGYANSTRAASRREKAEGGNHPEQYLFLSQRGEPLYRSKADARVFDAENRLRHAKVGQAVRQFMTERIIPYVREIPGAENFHYQFHDLRATFGMNLTDSQLELVVAGKATLHQVREFVKTRMGHASAATTDLYLQYRQNIRHVVQVGDNYESHLKALSEQAMRGLL